MNYFTIQFKLVFMWYTKSVDLAIQGSNGEGNQFKCLGSYRLGKMV